MSKYYDVVIAGVIKSSLATPATYDDEVLIEATRDVALGGSFTLAGSLSVTAGRDISAPKLSLMASAAGQHLLLGAGLARVVIACPDPHPLGAHGAERLKAAGSASPRNASSWRLSNSSW